MSQPNSPIRFSPAEPPIRYINCEGRQRRKKPKYIKRTVVFPVLRQDPVPLRDLSKLDQFFNTNPWQEAPKPKPKPSPFAEKQAFFKRRHKGCEICGLDEPLTRHHIIPRSVIAKAQEGFCRVQFAEQPKYAASLCRICHTRLHRQFTNEQLAATPWPQVAEAVAFYTKP